MCMMNDDEAKKFRELLKTMPKKHPFENAELCELYCYDNTPTYVTRPAYDAFTYPTYDTESQSFLYRHYDMEAETSDDLSVDLLEILEARIDDDFVKAVEICNMLNVPKSDIKACQEKILKMRNLCEERADYKSFLEPAYRNMIKPAIHKATEVIKVGDVVTDNGYHGMVVVTCIHRRTFQGYYLKDGVTVEGLDFNDFKKIASHVDVKIQHPVDQSKTR